MRQLFKKMLKRLGHKGQFLAEYGIVIAMIGAVFFSLQLYMKAKIQHVVKVASDELCGGQTEESAQSKRKVVPKDFYSNSEVHTESILTEVISEGEKRELTVNETTSKWGVEASMLSSQPTPKRSTYE